MLHPVQKCVSRDLAPSPRPRLWRRSSQWSNNFFASNFWQNRDRALGMGPNCFFHKDASTDMQYLAYLAEHVTSRDLDLRSNSEIDLYRSTCTHFDAFRGVEHDAAKIMSLAFLVQKLFVKNRFFSNKCYFDLSWPIAQCPRDAQPVEVRSILMTC